MFVDFHCFFECLLIVVAFSCHGGLYGQVAKHAPEVSRTLHLIQDCLNLNHKSPNTTLEPRMYPNLSQKSPNTTLAPRMRPNLSQKLPNTTLAPRMLPHWCQECVQTWAKSRPTPHWRQKCVENWTRSRKTIVFSQHGPDRRNMGIVIKVSRSCLEVNV